MNFELKRRGHAGEKEFSRRKIVIEEYNHTQWINTARGIQY
jgi:hypothetical protein